MYNQKPFERIKNYLIFKKAWQTFLALQKEKQVQVWAKQHQYKQLVN